MGNDRAEPGEQGTPEGSTLEEVHLAQFEYFDLLANSTKVKNSFASLGTIFLSLTPLTH